MKKNKQEKPYATIELYLHPAGVHLVCEDTGDDMFISRGDGDSILKAIDDIDIICDPETRFSLTDKGKQYLSELKEKGEI